MLERRGKEQTGPTLANPARVGHPGGICWLKVGHPRSGPPALARGRRIKRRIISCAQRGSRTYERTTTNQEVYYQPTGAKTQWHARVASAHTSSVTRMQIMVLRW